MTHIHIYIYIEEQFQLGMNISPKNTDNSCYMPVKIVWNRLNHNEQLNLIYRFLQISVTDIISSVLTECDIATDDVIS